jgi:hypothetical protein
MRETTHPRQNRFITSKTAKQHAMEKMDLKTARAGMDKARPVARGTMSRINAPSIVIAKAARPIVIATTNAVPTTLASRPPR